MKKWIKASYCGYNKNGEGSICERIEVEDGDKVKVIGDDAEI